MVELLGRKARELGKSNSDGRVAGRKLGDDADVCSSCSCERAKEDLGFANRYRLMCGTRDG